MGNTEEILRNRGHRIIQAPTADPLWGGVWGADPACSEQEASKFRTILQTHSGEASVELILRVVSKKPANA